jgi:hypothetical protein
MSCLLEKLAPETRTMVYEYVLSFDKPLKHATKMQPFIEKLTGVKPNSTSGSTGLETETAMEFRLVNTSLLTVNKLIYLEAVAVFCKHNSFYYDAEMCSFESLVSPCATDLSLAKQIFVKMDDAVDPEVEDKFGEAVNLSLTTIPAIFPMMRTCSVNISADTGPHAATILIAIYCNLRRLDKLNNVHFDGVGSFNASTTGVLWLKIIMQSKRAIDSWAKSAEIPATAAAADGVSAGSLYQNSRADSQNI